MLNCPFNILHCPGDKALPFLYFYMCLSTLWHFDIVPQCSLFLFLLTVTLLWYVVSWSWHFLFIVIVRYCEESADGTEIELLSGTHYPHHRLENMSPFFVIFSFFHSVHPSLLLALPLPLSSSFPPANSPAIIHQTASQYSQGRGKAKKTRERRENIFRNF